MEIELIKKILIAAAAIIFLAGTGLFFKPDWIQNLSRRGNRWITLRRATRVLDKPIEVDPWILRHSKPVGVVMILGGIYIIVRLFLSW